MSFTRVSLWCRLTLVLAASMLLAGVPSWVFAAEPRAGDTVVVGPGETLNDDLYAFGGNVTVQGIIRGDVISFAGNIMLSGEVAGDLMASGGTISVPGAVEGSVRVGGGTITIDGTVGDDVLAGAGTLILDSRSSVGRDLLFGVGSATIRGVIGRNVLGSGGEIIIDGLVGGDVQIEADRVQLTRNAVIEGNLIYASNREAEISEGAIVRGTVERRIPEGKAEPGPLSWAVSFFVSWARMLIGLFAFGLIFVLLFPAFSRRTVRTLGESPWPSLGLGFAELIAVPPISVIIFVLGLLFGGWWIGLMVLAVYGIALTLGFVMVGLAIGDRLLAQFGKARDHQILALLLGLTILTLVSQVPCVGAIVAFIAIFFGLGALTLAVARARQSAMAGNG